MNNLKELEEKKCNKLNTHMKLITQTILKNIPQVEAIILCGGFGRGEGTWIVKSDDVFPYNDYDIGIITDASIEISFLEKLRKQLAKEIGIRWIDIDLYSPQKIKRLHISIKNVDLLYGSKIIYGNQDIFRNCSMDADKIGFNDIETLYFTRLWTFFGIIDGDFKNLKVDDAIFFRNQMAKAVLAIVDVLLIKKRMYESSYRKRIRLFENLYADKKVLVKTANWALGEKLAPSISAISKEECAYLYNHVYWLYRREMLSALYSKYIFKIDTPKRYIWNYYMPLELMKKFYAVNIRGFRGYKKACMSRILQNAMFLAYNGGDIDERYMSDVHNTLKILGYEYTAGWEWKMLCPLVACIRNQK